MTSWLRDNKDMILLIGVTIAFIIAAVGAIGDGERIAAIVALTAWAWPLWLLGLLVCMFIELWFTATGRER